MKTLTWKLLNTPPTLWYPYVLDTFQKALTGWSDACGVRWIQEQGLQRANIAFCFRPLKGKQGSTRATCVPQADGSHLIIFGTHVQWQVWRPGFRGWLKRVFAPGGADAQDLLTFAIHEIGHALGLPHSDDELSVMYEFPEASGLKSAPTKEDARQAILRYPRDERT